MSILEKIGSIISFYKAYPTVILIFVISACKTDDPIVIAEPEVLYCQSLAKSGLAHKMVITNLNYFKSFEVCYVGAPGGQAKPGGCTETHVLDGDTLKVSYGSVNVDYLPNRFGSYYQVFLQGTSYRGDDCVLKAGSVTFLGPDYGIELKLISDKYEGKPGDKFQVNLVTCHSSGSGPYSNIVYLDGIQVGCSGFCTGDRASCLINVIVPNLPPGAYPVTASSCLPWAECYKYQGFQFLIK